MSVCHVHSIINAVKRNISQLVTICSIFFPHNSFLIQQTHINMIYNFYLIVNYIYCSDNITTIKYNEYTQTIL